MDGQTEGRTENRTPISHLAKAGATKMIESHGDVLIIHLKRKLTNLRQGPAKTTVGSYTRKLTKTAFTSVFAFSNQNISFGFPNEMYSNSSRYTFY